MGNAFHDLLALVDLGDLVFEKLVTADADVDDFDAFQTPCYFVSAFVAIDQHRCHAHLKQSRVLSVRFELRFCTW